MPGWPWIHDNSISVYLKIDPKRGNTHLTQINMAELRRLARDSLRIIRTDMEGHDAQDGLIMGLLSDTQNCGCACAGNAGNVFPITAGKWSRYASRHVRDARAVMHAVMAK